MIWAALSCYSAGPIITQNGRNTASDYMGILGNPGASCGLDVFLTMMQFFKVTFRPYTQPKVFILGLRSMKMHFVFPDQYNRQT